MTFTREDAYRTLTAINPAPIFLLAYHSEQLPEHLDIYFRPSEEFFLAPDSQAAYTEGKWVPILDNGGFSLVTFCDPATHVLRHMHVESPGEVRATFPNWKAFLDNLMNRVTELDDEKRIRRIAKLIGYSLLDE